MDQSLLDVRRPLKRSPNNSCSVAAEHAKGDLADDSMSRQSLCKHTNDKADHCGTSVEQLGPPKALIADLNCGCVLEPVVVGGGRRHGCLDVLRNITPFVTVCKSWVLASAH